MSQKKFRLTTGSLYQFALQKNFLSQRSRVSRHFFNISILFFYTCYYVGKKNSKENVESYYLSINKWDACIVTTDNLQTW